MNKRILGKLPIREAKESYIKMAFSKEVDENKVKYFIKAEIIEVEKEKILLMHFFNQRDLEKYITKAEFRVFQTQDDYITQDLSTTRIKWRTGSLASILNYSPCFFPNSGFYIEGLTLADRTTSGYLKEFFTKEIKNYSSTNNIKNIFALQEKIMKKRLEMKHKAITDVIDDQMKCVPELPEDFKEWIDEVAFYKSKYIYYEYKPNRKALNGYCTHCKTNVEVEHPKHNKSGVCPNCESNITFKALGKSKLVRDYGQAALIQTIGNKIIIRDFTINKQYDGHYKSPIISYSELKRVFIDVNEKTKIYEHAEFKQSGIIRWCDNECKFSFSQQALYDRNLDILKNTEWKYSVIKEFATHEQGYKFNVHGYLETYKKYPFIEYLVKLKLYNLVTDLIYDGWSINSPINRKGKKIDEILGINKSYIPMLQSLNATVDDLELLQSSITNNIKITEEQIKYIREQNINWNLLISNIKYANINRILKYIHQQVKSGFMGKNLIVEWRDYIDNCNKLNYNLKNDFILFPRDLIKAHNRTSDLVVEQKNKVYDRAIKKMYKKLTETYGWEWKDYKVIAPSSAIRIVHEGQALHHCVGTYLDRIKDGKTVVLFLRKKDDLENSFYTIEVKDGEIIQCRGMHNSSYDEDKEMKKVIDKFKRDRLLSLKKIEEAV